MALWWCIRFWRSQVTDVLKIAEILYLQLRVAKVYIEVIINFSYQLELKGSSSFNASMHGWSILCSYTALAQAICVKGHTLFILS